MATGRISKLTDKVQEEIVLAVRAGAPLEVAAQAAGIATTTFWDWMAAGEGRHSRMQPSKRNAEFAEAVRKAEGEAHIRAVGAIRQAIGRGSWQAAIAWAKMRWPKHYAERMEVSGPNGGAIPVELIGLLEGMKDDDIDRLAQRLRDALGSTGGGTAETPEL